MDFIGIAAGIVKSYVTKKGTEYIKKNFTNENKFESELAGVINDTMEAYGKLYPIKEDHEKISFFESQFLVDELLNFSLFESYDINALYSKLKDQPHILPVPLKELETFFDLFKKKVSEHPTLKKLETDFTYKEKITKMFELLQTLASPLSSTVQDLDRLLDREFQRQLSEIQSDLESFKPKTALQRLKSLETSITEANRMTDSLQGKIYYLKGLCYEDLHDDNETMFDYFIKAYKYNPSNFEYRLRACLTYFLLGEEEKWNSLLSQILEKDDYNTTGWFIKFVSDNRSFHDKIKSVPKKVIGNKTFLPVIYNWYLAKDIESAKIIEEQYLTPMLLHPELPSKITFANKDYWYILSFINIAVHHHENKITSLYLDKSATLENDPSLGYLGALLRIIENTFANSEIQEKFAIHFFYNSYLNFIADQSDKNLVALEKYYHLIQPPTSPYLCALVQAFITKEQDQKALAYINEFTPQNEDEAQYKWLFLLIVQRVLNNRSAAVEALKNYVRTAKIIRELHLYNILVNIENIFSSKEEIEDFQHFVFDHASFQYDYLQRLFILYIKTAFLKDFSQEQYEAEVIAIKSSKDFTDESLKHFLAICMYNQRDLKGAIPYLNSFVKKDQVSNSLYLYICCLLEFQESDKIELLKLLKWWRENAEWKLKFLRVEINYRYYIEDWPEIESATTKAIEKFPSEDHFIFMHLMALHRQAKSEMIKQQIPLIEKTEFKRPQDAVNVANILLLEGHISQSLEILYKSASKPENTFSRWTYFSSTIHYPDEFFVEYDEVRPGHYVRYSMEGSEEVVLVPKNEPTNNFLKELIGKKAGEEYFIKQPLGRSLSKVRIDRIMNKYLALCEIVTREADKPHSGIPLKKFTSVSDDIKEFEKQLVEEFGAEGTIRNETIKKLFNDYFTGVLSFSQLVNSIFNGNFIDGYRHLTSKFSDGFLTVPGAYCGEKFDTNKEVVLDASSVCTLFEILKELGLKPTKKFLVSPLIIQFIKDEISRVKLQRPSKLSINISLEGVVPIFFPDDYQEKRLLNLSELLNWVELYCAPLIIEKRIDLHLRIDQEGEEDTLMKIVVDSCLSFEAGYHLITNDFFIHRYFPHYKPYLLNPQIYLEKIFPEHIDSIQRFLLQNRFIGIDLSSPILMNEFVKEKAGKENNFQQCLMNLSFYYNSNTKVISLCAKFLKEVYMKSWLTVKQKNLVAQRVFLNLFYKNGNHETLVRLCRLALYFEFRMLGDTLVFILKEYEKALRILRKGS